MIKVSVVTVTFNAQEHLKKTIDSVLSQKYPDLEYLIIDGGSRDNTLQIANGYKNYFEERRIKFKVLVQKDNGIFDAMNKSLDHVDGDYVLFLNSGDFFVNDNVVSSVFEENSDELRTFDIIYGDFYAYSKGRRKRITSGTPESLPRKMICTHQAIFTKVELLRSRCYDTRYSMAADYDFYLEMYLKGKKFFKTDIPIVYFDIAGVSQKKARITQNERMELLHKHGCITQEEYDNRQKVIFIICLKKWIVSHLPSFIRFRGYELIKE